MRLSVPVCAPILGGLPLEFKVGFFSAWKSSILFWIRQTWKFPFLPANMLKLKCARAEFHGPKADSDGSQSPPEEWQTCYSQLREPGLILLPFTIRSPCTFATVCLCHSLLTSTTVSLFSVFFVVTDYKHGSTAPERERTSLQTPALPVMLSSISCTSDYITTYTTPSPPQRYSWTQ